MTGLFLAEQPGTHELTPVCGNGYWDLAVLKFYYCSVALDSLISSGVAMLLTLLLVFLVVWRLRSGVPGKLQWALEALLGYARGLVGETVSEDALFVVPIAATIAIYILIANWLDFLPLKAPIYPANSILNQTLAMAIVVIVVVQYYALRAQGPGGFFTRFLHPMPALLPLKIIEEIAKPITLALRLFGNIFAGVLMVFLIGELFAFGVTAGGMATVFAPLGLFFMILWKAFDVFFVGSIQAFIFMLLTIIYFGQAREGLEEEHHTSQEAAPAAKAH